MAVKSAVWQQAAAAWRRSAQARRRRLLVEAQQAAILRKQGAAVKQIAQVFKWSPRKVERLLAITGARLPSDRFWCGHPKVPDNMRTLGPDGRVGCRLCRNAQALAYYHKKTGHSPVLLERVWRALPRREARAG